MFLLYYYVPKVQKYVRDLSFRDEKLQEQKNISYAYQKCLQSLHSVILSENMFATYIIDKSNKKQS